MTDKEMDWDNYVKVFNLPIDSIKVKKTVSKGDVIMSLMSDGDIAFKFPNNQMMMKIDKIDDIELLEKIIWNPIKEYLRVKLKENEEKKEHDTFK